MSRIITPYPDTAEALMLLVEEWFPDEFAPLADGTFRTGRVFPPNVQDMLPFCRVTDIGGNDDGITDRPLIDVDIMAATFKQARDLAVGVQARVLGCPWRASNGVVLDRARTAMRPHDVPWDDDNVFRFYGSYIISARR